MKYVIQKLIKIIGSIKCENIKLNLEKNKFENGDQIESYVIL